MRHQLPRAKHLAVCSAALAGFGLAIAPAVAGASPPTTSPVVGNVYVNDNTTGVNTIAGFARHADASLTPLTGSPFVAGGAGRAPAWRHRVPFRSRPMASSSWPWMLAATRSRCCESNTTAVSSCSRATLCRPEARSR